MTLNYDLFIERALENRFNVRFADIPEYCDADRNWILIKLHGSVNWGQILQNMSSRRNELPVFVGDQLAVQKQIRVLPEWSNATRWQSSHFMYPSLAVPIGTRDGFVCPEEHCREMNNRLDQCRTLLTIGFSGYDTHVLNEITKHKFQYLRFVNRNADEARATAERYALAGKLSMIPEDVTFKGGGFKEFVISGELEQFVGV
jgi:hypothetical protein